MVKNFIKLFRSSTTEQLLDYNYLLSLLLSAGLNNEILHEQPNELSKYFGGGHQLKIWQYPNRFIDYLLFISKYKQHIDSYFEIGSRHGGTYIFTLEFLNKISNNHNINGYACDLIDIPLNISYYNSINNNSIYIQGDSKNFALLKDIKDKHISMVFIDGDHSYFGVKSDTSNVLFYNQPKILVLHDISSVACRDVCRYWVELKIELANSFNFYEFVDQYDSVPYNYLGIGVAIRKDIDII